MIVAPTGTTAALIGGSTYHSMFGINDFNTKSQQSQVKTKLAGVEHVFFEISVYALCQRFISHK